MKNLFGIIIFFTLTINFSTAENHLYFNNYYESNYILDSVGNIESNIQGSAVESKTWIGKFLAWISQPVRPVWGWYDEGGNKIDAPYTTFDLTYDNTLVQAIYNNIRDNNRHYRDLYKTIIRRTNRSFTLAGIRPN